MPLLTSNKPVTLLFMAYLLGMMLGRNMWFVPVHFKQHSINCDSVINPNTFLCATFHEHVYSLRLATVFTSFSFWCEATSIMQLFNIAENKICQCKNAITKILYSHNCIGNKLINTLAESMSSHHRFLAC